MGDADIIDKLRQIDEHDEIECTEWEAEVLDEIKKLPKPRVLNAFLRAKAARVIERYEHLID